MKKFFIYSFFIMFFPIYSSEKNKGWTQISWMGWGLATIQKTENLSELEKEKIHKELRMNSFFISFRNQSKFKNIRFENSIRG